MVSQVFEIEHQNLYEKRACWELERDRLEEALKRVKVVLFYSQERRYHYANANVQCAIRSCMTLAVRSANAGRLIATIIN